MLTSSAPTNDALFTLSYKSDVTGVCFVRDPTTSLHAAFASRVDTSSSSDENDVDDDDNNSATDEDDDDLTLQFRCSNLLLGPHHNRRDVIGLQGTVVRNCHQHATNLSAASYGSLAGGILASCHVDGICRLWDLATRRCYMENLGPHDTRQGPGLAIRRVNSGGGNDDNDNTAINQFLYQTRDPLGTVSLHDLHRPCTPLLQIHTYSTTFCAMSPCHLSMKSLSNNGCEEKIIMSGARNLVALPTEEQSLAIVRDLRCDPKGSPAWQISLGDEYISSIYGTRRKYGMLSSLALCLQETTHRIVLGCGMENGSTLFYDLGGMGQAVESSPGESRVVSDAEDSRFMCSTALGKGTDPVLCLDVVSSKTSASVVAVAGCAGDADDLSELPEHDQGTVSIIKVKLSDETTSHDSSKYSTMKAKVRSKTRTCSIESGGKVGVSICRFRPDGRVFAVGGWDYRLRIFGRTSSKPLAILRGHEKSVTAMDWASNSAASGLLATGAGDGKICIWRVFPHSLRT